MLSEIQNSTLSLHASLLGFEVGCSWYPNLINCTNFGKVKIPQRFSSLSHGLRCCYTSCTISSSLASTVNGTRGRQDRVLYLRDPTIILAAGFLVSYLTITTQIRRRRTRSIRATDRPQQLEGILLGSLASGQAPRSVG